MTAPAADRQIGPMTLADLDRVLGWAEAEGWNPGLDDAAAFLNADPEGFLICKSGGAPVSAISVVNHSDDFAFLGLYLCHPSARGQGHGWAVWQAGLAHAGGRTVGLDGVTDQQANYAKSGFVRSGQTVRLRGVLPRSVAPELVSVSPATANDIDQILTDDAARTGVARRGFLRGWLAGTRTRQTRVIRRDGRVAGYATLRSCAEGSKIGPFHATDRADAMALMSCWGDLPGTQDCSIDVPDPCTGFRDMLAGLGMVSVFDTARMYLGPAPASALAPFSAVATLELG